MSIITNIKRQTSNVILLLLWKLLCIGATEKNDVSVIILGGGVAGIQAASQLTQQGVKDFLIIEQANRIGGRMWNTQWEGLTVELGIYNILFK